MKKSLIDRIVYKITCKPAYYKEVKNPPKTTIEKLLRPQEARQVQYNNWSKAHKVYSGSYLPENEQRLLKKGWSVKKIFKNGNRTIQRKSTGQTVRSDNYPRHHYHWLDYWEKPYVNSHYNKFRDKEFSGQMVYYNKYGELTHKGDPEHHLYGDKND